MTRSRLESFTDAILAIIMTIMALEIHTPSHPNWTSFSTLFLPLFAYFVSFFGLTNLWMAHHQLIHNVKEVGYRSVFLNMLLLFWVTMVPVSTSWVADYPAKALPEQFFILIQLGWFILLEALIRSVKQEHPAEVDPNLSVISWWAIVLLLFFLIFPLPYSGLVIGVLLILRVLILWIKNGRLR
ncbi:TMEM175 family protein [Furfurilactobacillus siliginis]|uniref:Integral membrane protein n=1 Tax=Furfurilactobacillus siliginis TaxID=348151 RepID=A0A0R2L9P5_9LACO|nr:TMEM175 family protein [Furfurilactobacillus siliginis]KRN96060.1 hypothetical protein IV55_GL001743 [Furfurilactobacillus siliginis]GEK28766.1 hypothetical protein LSI01_10770 [Furfurilactobacillus siliginis]